MRALGGEHHKHICTICSFVLFVYNTVARLLQTEILFGYNVNFYISTIHGGVVNS